MTSILKLCRVVQAGFAAAMMVLLLPACSVADDRAAGSPGSGLQVPPGFRIDVYVDDLPNARSMAMGEGGTLFVATQRAGVVYAVTRSADGSPGEIYTVARRLTLPNGVAFRNGALYVAAVNRILRYDEIESRLDDPPEPVVVNDSFPRDRHHGWKYIAFGPDDKLYVPIGAPCNVCDEAGYANISRIDPDGSNQQIVARGIRNTVGFTWHPETDELWFTDNG